MITIPSLHAGAALFATLLFSVPLLMLGSCSEDSPDVNISVTIAEEPTATNSKTQFAETGGRKIAYRSIGKGEPIILCQRFRGNLDDWDPAFLDALAKNYRVITFDYTGFASSTGNPPENMLGFATDVKDLATALQLPKIIVGGWSFGGFVAQIVTTQFPELVSQTILIGTRPPGKSDYTFEEIFLQTAYKPGYDFEDNVILFFEPASEMSRAAAKASYERIMKRTEGRDVPIEQPLWQFYSKGFADFEKDPYDAKQKLMAMKTPMLVISSDHEVSFPVENWHVVNRQFPTAQLMVFPQAGHGPHHQYPELIAGYITGFIENNKRTAL